MYLLVLNIINTATTFSVVFHVVVVVLAIKYFIFSHVSKAYKFTETIYLTTELFEIVNRG